MRARRGFARRGFTLVELMIVVAIIGVLAALAIYGVRRYIATAKVSEAKNSVGAISRAAQLAYERETLDSQLLGDKNDSVASSHALCKSAMGPVPAAVPAGKKYQPSTQSGQDFDAGDPLTGWKCLRFNIESPIYFRYDYRQGGGYISAPLPGGLDPGATGFEASAQGDLDDDGVFSTFAVGGTITATNHLKISTQVFVHNELE